MLAGWISHLQASNGAFRDGKIIFQKLTIFEAANDVARKKIARNLPEVFIMGIKQSLRRAGLAFAALLVSAGIAAGAGPEYASNGMGNASPAEVYLRYIEVLSHAQSLPEIFPFSPNTNAQNMKDLESLSPEQRKQGLAGIKAMSLNPEGAKVLSQKITGDTAMSRATPGPRAEATTPHLPLVH